MFNFKTTTFQSHLKGNGAGLHFNGNKLCINRYAFIEALRIPKYVATLSLKHNYIYVTFLDFM